MVDKSYVKLFRSLKDWKWISHPNMVAVWVRILLEANYEETTWHGVLIPKGSFPTSIKILAEKCGLSIQQTRTCISNLQITNEITVKTTNKYTVITVNKWEEYQGLVGKSTSKITNNISQTQQTNNKQPNNTIRNKNIRNKEIRNKYINNNAKMPLYDTSRNRQLSEQELNELLALRKGDYES